MEKNINYQLLSEAIDNGTIHFEENETAIIIIHSPESEGNEIRAVLNGSRKEIVNIFANLLSHNKDIRDMIMDATKLSLLNKLSTFTSQEGETPTP